MPVPVLVLVQHLDHGGTEGHIHDLVAGLDRARFEPHVIHFNHEHGMVADKLAATAGVRKTYIPVAKAYNTSGLRAVRAVRKYIRHHDIRAVVTFHFMADFIGTLAAWGTRARVISSRRDMGFTRTGRQLQMGRWLNLGVARYIAVSGPVRQAIGEQEGIPLDKIEVIHNGIDLDEMNTMRWDVAAERARYGLKAEDVLIACVANFNPVKGHRYLIEAMAILRDRNPQTPVCLRLVGIGPLMAEMEGLVAERGLIDHVMFVGFSADVTREFKLSDIVTLPSETEGFSNAIVQAMALGRPVVACNVGGNPEAIADGETGFLVAPRDAAALASALGRLAGDAELRARMGAAGRDRARALFTKDLMLERQMTLLERVIAHKTVRMIIE